MSDKNVPYEKWSRESFKLAYEEADLLLKSVTKERNELREKLRELDQWKNMASLWADHAMILGRQIAANLGLKQKQ